MNNDVPEVPDGIIPNVLMNLLTTTTIENSSPVRQMLPQMLFVMGVVIMLVLAMISLRRRGMRPREHESPREKIDRIKTGQRSRDVENTLSAEFISSAQEIAARLDNKFERLEQLVMQADERIAHLKALQESPQKNAKSEKNDLDQLTLAFRHEHNSKQQPDPPQRIDPLTRSVYDLADAGHGPVEIAQQLDEQVGKVELILALRHR